MLEPIYVDTYSLEGVLATRDICSC